MIKGHPRHLEIERLVAGELTETAQTQLTAHLSDCPDCQAYRDELEAERSELLAQQPPALFAAQIFEREQRPFLRKPRTWWFIGGLTLATTTAAVLLILGHQPPPAPRPDEFRLMGPPSVRVFLRRGEQVSMYVPTAPIQAGDALRFEVTTDEEAYLALIAIPEGEEEPLVLSPEGTEALHLTRGQIVMPGSVEVTDDPEPVLLLILIRTQPFSLADAVAEIHEARQGHPLYRWDGTGVSGTTWTMLVEPDAP